VPYSKLSITGLETPSFLPPPSLFLVFDLLLYEILNIVALALWREIPASFEAVSFI
jgi:hypothetical protein